MARVLPVIHNPYSGLLVVFDGIDGCGKTHQLQNTARWINETFNTPLTHRTVKTYKEPGKNGILGARIYKELRQELPLTGGLHRTDPMSFQTWYACDSKENVSRNVIPFLYCGCIVLADRYRSSMVYGARNKKELEILMEMNARILGEHFIWPDVMFVFDVDVGTALTRLRKKSAQFDGHERSEVLTRVRKNFLTFAKLYPNCCVINGNRPADEVFSEVKTKLEPMIKSMRGMV